MGVTGEKSFPRGGKKPGVAAPSKGKFNLFHTKSVHKKQKVKPKDKEKLKKNITANLKYDVKMKQTSVELLSYKSISEGMLILGCVKDIGEFKVTVNLPGRLLGEIPITNISEPYTKALQQIASGNGREQNHYQLDQMFKVGQHVVMKVTEVARMEDNKFKVILTSSPREVHFGWSHKNVQEGLVMTAAVSSEEDHGYIMDLGITGVQAFLKKAKAQQFEETWNGGVSLGVGQLVRCVITKAKCSDLKTTVELSANQQESLEVEGNSSQVTLQTLLPGMLFTATMNRIIHSGVQVNFAKNLIGYVHEEHLNAPDSSLTDVNIGETYPARVLYIHPIVKTVFLTLLDGVCDAQPLLSPYDVFSVGDIIKEAKVRQVTGRAVLLSLPGGLQGFVSFRHANEKLNKDSDEPLHKQLMTLYPNDSSQKCRILGYDFMAQMYSCTLNKSELKATISRLEDYEPGSPVTCVVEEVNNSGLQVSIGSKKHPLFGFVSPLHMADIPLAHPEKKFTVGATYEAKVWNVQNHELVLTMKPSLIHSSIAPLTRVEDIKINEMHEGVVVHTTSKGILVVFYNDIKGWVPNHYLSQDEYVDARKLFYKGQVVKCYIVTYDKKSQRMTLSLKPLGGDTNGVDVNTGEPYKLVITDIVADCLHVKVASDDSWVTGIIPAQHLTDSCSLSMLLLATYTVGDTLTAYCFSSFSKSVIFSIHPSVIQFFQSEEGRGTISSEINDLDKKILMPCSIRSINNNGIWVDLPIPYMKKGAWVPLSHLTDHYSHEASSLGLSLYQVLMAKLVHINIEDQSSVATTKLSECWKGDIQDGVILLQSYMNDCNKIKSYLRKKKDPLGDLTSGRDVIGVVKTVTDIGAVIELPGNVQAVAMPYHYKGMKLKPGQEVQGRILAVDMQNHCVELTISKGIIARVNKIQDGIVRGAKLGTCLRGETVVAKPDQVVVSLKGAGRLQLASVPVRCHLNDLFPRTRLYKLGKENKIVITAIHDGVVIGIHKAMISKKRSKSKSESNNDLSDHCDESTEKTLENKIKTISTNLISSVMKSPNKILKKDTSEEIDIKDDPEVINKTGKKKKMSKQVKEMSESNIPESSNNTTMKKMIRRENDICSTVVQECDKINDKSKKLQNKRTGKTEIEQESIKKRKRGSACETEVEHEQKSREQDVAEECRQPKLKSSLNKKSKTSVGENDGISISNSKVNASLNSESDLPRLSNIGFVWDARPEMLPAVARARTHVETSSDEEDTSEQEVKKKKKLTPAEKRELARKEEERLRDVERQLMDAERNPQSADDFDRLVLSSPNSSVCWIKYMAFHLQATEIEKARAVAERALKTISFREEQEKLNVWMALLNLENLYGTKESLGKILQEAVQMNNDYKVYMQMLQIYAESSKIQEVDKLVHLVTKKFREKKDTWLQAGEVYMKCGQIEKARMLMQKALTALEKRDHVEVISRFALLENKHGETERGQTLMENILTSYPKRIDVWCTYVDMLVKSERVDLARQVLERAVIQKLTPHKIKALYKKFLQFEEQYGTPEGADKVRQMALEYVESATNTDEIEQ